MQKFSNLPQMQIMPFPSPFVVSDCIKHTIMLSYGALSAIFTHLAIPSERGKNDVPVNHELYHKILHIF